MNYAILRTAKLKTMGNIGGSLAHNYRTIETPNADPNLTLKNHHSVATPEAVKQAIKDRLPEKRRSDAVLCIEYLITASPEWDGWGNDKEAEFFKRAGQWLIDKHGEENIAGMSIHQDISTPHLVAYVVPIDQKGKLNCKDFLGGRAKLNQMQTDFADTVADLGLTRGKEGSKAKHTSIKEYYHDINHARDFSI
ncbi:MobV family relaxase, partial [Aeromonas sp. ARM81]